MNHNQLEIDELTSAMKYMIRVKKRLVYNVQLSHIMDDLQDLILQLEDEQPDNSEEGSN
jgi:hypothetical protein